MSKSVMIDVLHVSLFMPKHFHNQQAVAFRRVLNRKKFSARCSAAFKAFCIKRHFYAAFASALHVEAHLPI